MLVLAADDPLAIEATQAVQAGDLDRLAQLLEDNRALATARIGVWPDGMSRTLLHAARRSEATEVVDWLLAQGARSADSQNRSRAPRG